MSKATVGTQYERRMVPVDAIRTDNGFARREVRDSVVQELAKSISMCCWR